MMLTLQLFLLSLSSLFMHPFYVSISNIDYNQQEKRIEVSCRIFYDDLEEVLVAQEQQKIDLLQPKNRSEIDSALQRYLTQHFTIRVNNKAVPLHYLGYEIIDDVAWCYLEAPHSRSIKTVVIDNTLLFAHFPKQSNILHLNILGTRKSTKLDAPKSKASFSY